MSKFIKRVQNGGNYYYFGDPPIHLRTFELSQTSLIMNTIGGTYQLSLTMSPSYAIEKEVVWESSNEESGATVTQNGLITRTGESPCTITVRTKSGPYTADCTIDITHPTSITLNKSNIGLNNIGDTYQLTATVLPNNTVHKDVTWSSSDESIATVSNTGLVTCVTPGTCVITATTVDGGLTATCNVAITKTIKYILVGGGGGGGCLGGGGGGAVCLGQIERPDLLYSISIGQGGAGQSTTGLTGGNSCISVSGTALVTANGGTGGYQRCGGTSGTGCVGGACCDSRYCSGGGGGGSSGVGCRTKSVSYGGQGGPGCCGYGGGGGGAASDYCVFYAGKGLDGGGNGGYVNSSPYTASYGCNATNCGGGGGGHSSYCYCTCGNGGGGLAEICYPSDGTYGYTCATGGNTCCTVTVDNVVYCVHRFTSDGTFCIVC